MELGPEKCFVRHLHINKHVAQFSVPINVVECCCHGCTTPTLEAILLLQKMMPAIYCVLKPRRRQIREATRTQRGDKRPTHGKSHRQSKARRAPDWIALSTPIFAHIWTLGCVAIAKKDASRKPWPDGDTVDDPF